MQGRLHRLAAEPLTRREAGSASAESGPDAGVEAVRRFSSAARTSEGTTWNAFVAKATREGGFFISQKAPRG